MASIADITVKKNDGTTDIVYTAMQPSSGDGVPAVWRSETGGTATAFKPTLSLSTRWNGAKTARRITAEYRYPQTATDSTTGLTNVVNVVPGSMSIVIPSTTPSSVSDEAVSQMINLLNSALIKGAFKNGYSPT